MLAIEFSIRTNLKDEQTILSIAGGAVAKHITGLLKDIKDPITGASPEVLMSPHHEGVRVTLRGSSAVYDEAVKRIEAMLKT